ncbi:MAG: hypothetical protein NTZ25_06115 [Candidatus Peregrinibacteria bacterium]|nr:hypothetical protein [Candidatus Peregrinibacteria bacterium]
MGRGEEEKKGPDEEFDQSVAKTLVILRESVKRLIENNGGVVLRADVFSRRVDVLPSFAGMVDVESVMRELTFDLKQVFLDARTPFNTTAGEKIVSIKRALRYPDGLDYQIIPRRVDDKGRITLGRPDFLKGSLRIKAYSQKKGGKLYIVISDPEGLDLIEHGYGMRNLSIDKHRRIVLRDVNLPQIPKGGVDFKLVTRGFYALIAASDDEDSQFASISDYEKEVLPLMEAQK